VVDPYDSTTRANLGRLLASEGDWKQAAFHLKKAVQLDTANVSAHEDYAVALLQLQRFPEAETEAEAAVTADPKSARAHDFLGQLLAQKGKMAAAGAEFEKALGLDPEFGPAQLDFAETLIQRGQVGSAVPLLLKAERSSMPDIAQRAHALLQQTSPSR